MSPRLNSREIILKAAEDVVFEVGAAHMTLDAVAKKAGISKGGLIYNFPNKDALLQAMIKRMVERFNKSREKMREKIKNKPYREIEAHVRSFLDIGPKTDRLAAALLAAMAHNPKLLDPVRDEYKKLLENVTSGGIKVERATVVAFATDGLKLMEMLGLSPLSKKQRKAVIEEMIKIAKES